jgi:DNA-binding transcriptional ArsR family regulator
MSVDAGYFMGCGGRKIDFNEIPKRHILSTDPTPMPRASAHADVFHAIADPTRRAILDRLRAGPAPVNALASSFERSRPAVSKHLRVLRLARLVTEERVGRERVYQLQATPLQQIAGWLEGYRTFWLVNLESLKRHVEEDK